LSITHVQALDCAVRAMAVLRDRPDIRLVLVGSRVAEQPLRALVQELGLTAVTFYGRASPTMIPDLMAAADAQPVSLRADPFLAATTPSKLQAILASAQPVIAALAGDGAELVRQSGAGVVCPPGDGDELASRIVELCDRRPVERAALAAAGYAYYHEHMSVAMTATRVESALQTISGSR
jgi:glycosyltransferase involved in cell wall biosynthesis